MSDWAKQRKLNIQVSTITVILVIIISIAFVVLYDRPSCTDGLHNQGEEGTDCGGPCSRECVFATSKPSILWGRAFRISPTLHSVIYYIENKNTTLTAKDLPYRLKFFDKKGEYINDYRGVVSIYPSFITPIFIPHIKTGEREIETTSIEFTQEPNWQPALIEIPPLLTLNQRIEYPKKGGARGHASIVNETISPINDIDVYAVIFDQRGNAVSAASTYIQTLKSKEEIDVIFTWVNDIKPIEYVCDAKSDLFLLTSNGSVTAKMIEIKTQLEGVLADVTDIQFLSKPKDLSWENVINDLLPKLDKTKKLYFAIVEEDSVLTGTIKIAQLLNSEYNIPTIVFADAEITESIKKVLGEKGIDSFIESTDFDDISIRKITQEIKYKKCKGEATSIEVLTVPNI